VTPSEGKDSDSVIQVKHLLFLKKKKKVTEGKKNKNKKSSKPLQLEERKTVQKNLQNKSKHKSIKCFS